MPAPAEQRSATAWVVGGSAVSGVAAYVFQVAAARALGEEGYAPIGVLWTLQYLAFSVPLISIEAYLTKLRARVLLEPAALRDPLRRVALVVLGVAVVVGLVTYAGREALYQGDAGLALVAAGIVGAYGAFAVARGLLAGAERFRLYGVGTGGESLARLVVALPVLALVGTTSALAWTMPVGPVVVGLWWAAERRARGAGPLLGTGTGTPLPRSRRPGLGALTAANACAQTLLAAGPLVLLVLGAGPVEVSVFFVTTTAARAPLQFLIGGLLSRVLPPLARLAATDETALRRVVLLLGAGTAVISVAGGAFGWVVGPALIGLLFGAGFTPSALLAGLTGFTVLAVSGCLLLDQVFVARGTTARLLAPWASAVGVAVLAIALLDGTPTDRVAGAVALAVGVALAWLTVRARGRGAPAGEGAGGGTTT